MSTVVTNEVIWNEVPESDLDPTPVGDLEAWTYSYDPRAAAELDAKLDAAFGPLPGGAR